MVETRWQVRFTLDELPVPVVPLPFTKQASSGWDEWRAVSDVPVGTPFLVSPGVVIAVVTVEVTFAGGGGVVLCERGACCPVTSGKPDWPIVSRRERIGRPARTGVAYRHWTAAGASGQPGGLHGGSAINTTEPLDQ